MIFCPVCTIAVAGGAGLSRWLGIDDTISGVWIGGLLASLTIWCLHRLWRDPAVSGGSWLERRNIWLKVRFRFRWLAMAAVLYSSVIAPLYKLGMIGSSCDNILGVDKLLVGITFGSITFLAGNWLYSFVKRMNDDRVYFPYQKVVVPVFCLAATSAVFYLLTNC